MNHSLFHIEIPKRNASCHRNGESLIPGMEYYSLLSYEDQKVIRCDFCLSCWQLFLTEMEGANNQIYWKSRIEIKKESKPIREESRVIRALSLLKNLLEDTSKNEVEIFILALFLAYARRLILRQEIEKEGHIYFLYEVAHQDEFLLIKKIELSQLETAKIQESLSKQLNSTC